MRALLCFLAALGGASAFHAGATLPVAAPVLRRGCASSAVGARMQAETGKGKLLVLGGTGFVGSTVAKLALDRGYEVVSMSRRGKPPADSKLAGQAQVSQHQRATRIVCPCCCGRRHFCVFPMPLNRSANPADQVGAGRCNKDRGCAKSCG